MYKYLPLAIVALLPVLLSAVLYYAYSKPLAHWSNRKKQLLAGLCFGLVAIFGTEFGVPMDGLKVNVRDAAPICAGLIFGAPAGIMAGLIGGIERYLAAWWGAGFYTQLACTLGTIFAGFFAAALRRYMFDDKKPGWVYGLAVGGVAEIVHMTLIFFTNMNDAKTGFHFIHLCTIPMVTANACSVMLALLVVGILGKEKIIRREGVPQIAETFQKWLLLCIVVAFGCAFSFTYVLQTGIYQRNTEETFRQNIEDVKREIISVAGRNEILNGEGGDEEGRHLDSSPENLGLLIGSITENWHVGEDGYMLVFDKEGNLISKAVGAKEHLNEENTRLDWDSLPEREMSLTAIGGTEAYVMPLNAGDYRILAVAPAEKADFSRNLSVYLMTFVIVLIFSALFILIYCLIRRMIVDKIHTINSSLGRITAGQLDEVVNVRDSEEFISLSDDINNTVATLKHYIDEAAARIDRELEFAREIQYSSLPSIFPPFPQHKEFDIFASMDTAKEVGGDFYDFYFVGPDKLAFLVADVSGKGIPAAMFMMRARAVIKALAETGATVDEIFRDANDTLCQGNERGMFVTAWLGILDIHTGELDYVNGGHTPPYILHPDGSGEWVKKKSGIMLGSLEDVPYAPRHITLSPGDTIYVYTDGVPENANEAGEFFGEERLEKILLAARGLEPVPLCIKVKEELDAFTGGAEQFDDITMLALRYTGETAE
ncbi:MAG: hypothetical protein E7200_01230 [Selenomonas ruminantium]|nr:hypothetical protein [Selenomonas ruminantium]